MDYNSLQHWGIKGMKWGVRRYQNKDGTLTDAGKKRMYGEMFDQESKEDKVRKRYVADANRWVNEDISNTKGVVDATASLNRELERANTTLRRKPKEPDIDLSNMSDKEMRDAINRKLLERQYKEMVVPQNTSRGKETVESILAVTGTTLGIASSSLAIALSIRKLMGKG
jgi:hypothetical protein